MPGPEVAVIVPCYNYARLLPDAVGSVVAQTWPHIECVIVDDGSPDDTAAVAGRLIRAHPEREIRLLRQENKGLAEARNAGVRATTAPLILPLDADDMFVPHAVERMVQAFQRDPSLDVVGCWAREFGDRDLRIVARPTGLSGLLKRNYMFYASMYRRSAYERTDGYDANMRYGYEDWNFWITLMAKGSRFRTLQEELFLYRKHGRTMIADADERELWLRSRIVLNHPRLFERERVRLAEDTLAHGPREPGFLLRLRWLYFFTKDGMRPLMIRQLRAMWRLLRS